MTITSYGYDTVDGINEGQWAAIADRLGSAYSVDGATDWKVNAVTGLDRTVSIGLGAGCGRGVRDVLSGTPPTLQSAIVGSGSRWDTVVLRRDWTTPVPGGTSSFVMLTGTATQAVSASRLSSPTTPGNVDDQLVALVQVTAGVQVPTVVIDLRSQASKVHRAATLLAFPGAALGTEVVVAGVRYRRELDSTLTLVWVPSNRSESGLVTHSYGGGHGPVLTNITFDTPFTSPPAISLSSNSYALQLNYGGLGNAGFGVYSRGVGTSIPPSGNYSVSWTATGS